MISHQNRYIVHTLQDKFTFDKKKFPFPYGTQHKSKIRTQKTMTSWGLTFS